MTIDAVVGHSVLLYIAIQYRRVPLSACTILLYIQKTSIYLSPKGLHVQSISRRVLVLDGIRTHTIQHNKTQQIFFIMNMVGVLLDTHAFSVVLSIDMNEQLPFLAIG